MRTTILAVVFILSVAVLAGTPASCDTPKASRESYPVFSISAEIPNPHKDFDGGTMPGSLMDKAYVCNGLAYDVVVVPVVPGSRSKAAVEQCLDNMLGLTNRMAQLIATRHPGQKWNASSKNSLQFTGITVDDFIMEPSFAQIVPDRKASISMAIAGLKSDYSQLVLVQVAGSRARRPEIEAATKAMAQSVDKAGSGGVQTQTLKPDQIELIGVVDSIASDSKSLVLKVDTVNAKSQATVSLNPPRPKTVLLNSLPDEVIIGSRIKVVGQNSGSGKPIKAESISPASP